MTTKPFDLARAMANGGRCQTRDGRPARIICTDAKNARPIVALLEDAGGEYAVSRLQNGRAEEYEDTPYDLVNVPEKRSGWININTYGDDSPHRYSHLYDTQDRADADASPYRIACILIEWEE